MSNSGINYVVGDATKPIGDGVKFIVHVCNDIGGWGRGFVMAISKRWAEPERQYRNWHSGKAEQPFALGEVQLVQVESDIFVANLIGQHDIRSAKGVPPIRYDAIRRGLASIAAEAKRMGASLHMPRIGCGLAGGNWKEIEKIIREEVVDRGIKVVVYDLSNTGP